MATHRRWTREEVQKLKAMQNTGHQAKHIAKALGRTISSVYNAIHRESGGAGYAEPITEQKSFSEHGDRADCSFTTLTPVRTIDDALRKAEIDTTTWAVDRCKINSWEQASKDAEGNVTKTPLWQVALWLVKKRGWSRPELTARIVQELKRKRPKRKAAKKRKPKTRKTGTLAELSIMDHHFGKLAWEPEVGGNYDVAIARDRYNAASHRLLEQISEEKPSRILKVVGNDFYHVDKGDNTTTRGTPQDADGRWQKAFVTGLACVRESIETAREIAPVTVVVVPGNHDTERAFTLGVVLSALYENDSRVNVDNGPDMKKCFVWGKTMLSFFHGHNMSKSRLEQLPSEMASRWPKEFAATQWREWHMGHLHSESESVWRNRTSESIGDIIVRRLPSLCGTDRWHYEMGYRSLGAAEAHFYSSEFGRLCTRTVTELEIAQLTKEKT